MRNPFRKPASTEDALHSSPQPHLTPLAKRLADAEVARYHRLIAQMGARSDREASRAEQRLDDARWSGRS